jgi:hypothetical protein
MPASSERQAPYAPRSSTIGSPARRTGSGCVERRLVGRFPVGSSALGGGVDFGGPQARGSSSRPGWYSARPAPRSCFTPDILREPYREPRKRRSSGAMRDQSVGAAFSDTEAAWPRPDDELIPPLADDATHGYPYRGIVSALSAENGSRRGSDGSEPAHPRVEIG